MPEPLRVLVTGSREWDAPDVIEDELDLVVMRAREEKRGLIVVHGKNRRGADRTAQEWAREKARQGWPVREEPHPADWDAPCRAECKPGHRRGPRERRSDREGDRTYCPAVGQYRNAHMVSLGADVCLAFIRADSPGATGCATLAEDHGIRTLRFHYERMEGS
jgi:SLOG family YspA-like protein